eukprot:4562520-Pleurochrysis_carterae.AAC.1
MPSMPRILLPFTAYAPPTHTHSLLPPSFATELRDCMPFPPIRLAVCALSRLHSTSSRRILTSRTTIGTRGEMRASSDPRWASASLL